MKIVQIVANQDGDISYVLDESGQIWSLASVWDEPAQYSTRKFLRFKWVRFEVEGPQVSTESADEGTT